MGKVYRGSLDMDTTRYVRGMQAATNSLQEFMRYGQNADVALSRFGRSMSTVNLTKNLEGIATSSAKLKSLTQEFKNFTSQIDTLSRASAYNNSLFTGDTKSLESFRKSVNERIALFKKQNAASAQFALLEAEHQRKLDATLAKQASVLKLTSGATTAGTTSQRQVDLANKAVEAATRGTKAYRDMEKVVKSLGIAVSKADTLRVNSFMGPNFAGQNGQRSTFSSLNVDTVGRTKAISAKEVEKALDREMRKYSISSILRLPANQRVERFKIATGGGEPSAGVDMSPVEASMMSERGKQAFYKQMDRQVRSARKGLQTEMTKNFADPVWLARNVFGVADLNTSGLQKYISTTMQTLGTDYKDVWADPKVSSSATAMQTQMQKLIAKNKVIRAKAYVGTPEEVALKRVTALGKNQAAIDTLMATAPEILTGTQTAGQQERMARAKAAAEGVYKGKFDRADLNTRLDASAAKEHLATALNATGQDPNKLLATFQSTDQNTVFKAASTHRAAYDAWQGIVALQQKSNTGIYDQFESRRKMIVELRQRIERAQIRNQNLGTMDPRLAAELSLVTAAEAQLMAQAQVARTNPKGMMGQTRRDFMFQGVTDLHSRVNSLLPTPEDLARQQEANLIAIQQNMPRRGVVGRAKDLYGGQQTGIQHLIASAGPMKDEFKLDAAQAAQRVAEAYSKTGLPIENFMENIGKLRKAQGGLHLQFGELATAVNGFDRAARGAQGNMKDMVLTMNNLARLVNARLLTYFFYGMMNQAMAAFQEATKVSKVIGEIMTISQDPTNMSSQNGKIEKTVMSYKEWGAALEDIATTFNMTRSDVGSAMYEAVSNQIGQGQQAVDFVEQAARFAKATRSTTMEGVNLLSAVLNGYGLSVYHTEEVAAQMFKVIELGRVRAPELANTIGRITMVGNLANTSISDLGAAIAQLTIAGVKPEKAMTYLGNIMNKMVKPTPALKELFASWGVDSGEAALKVYGLVGVLERLQKASGGSLEELGKDMRDIRTIIGTAGLLRDVDKFKQVSQEIETGLVKYRNAITLVRETPGENVTKQLNAMKQAFIDAAGGILVFVDAKQKAASAKGWDLSQLLTLAGTTLGAVTLGVGGAKMLKLTNKNPLGFVKGVGKAGLLAGVAGATWAGGKGFYDSGWNSTKRVDLGDRKQEATDMAKDFEAASKRVEKIQEALTATTTTFISGLTKMTEAGVQVQQQILETSKESIKLAFAEYNKELAKNKGIVEALGNFFDTKRKDQQELAIAGAPNKPTELLVRQGIIGQTISEFQRANAEGNQGNATRLFSEVLAQMSSLNKDYAMMGQNVEKVYAYSNYGRPDKAQEAYSALGTPGWNDLTTMQFMGNKSGFETFTNEFINSWGSAYGISGRDLPEIIDHAKTVSEQWDNLVTATNEVQTEISKRLDKGLVNWDELIGYVKSLGDIGQLTADRLLGDGRVAGSIGGRISGQAELERRQLESTKGGRLYNNSEAFAIFKTVLSNASTPGYTGIGAAQYLMQTNKAYDQEEASKGYASTNAERMKAQEEYLKTLKEMSKKVGEDGTSVTELDFAKLSEASQKAAATISESSFAFKKRWEEQYPGTDLPKLITEGTNTASKQLMYANNMYAALSKEFVTARSKEQAQQAVVSNPWAPLGNPDTRAEAMYPLAYQGYNLAASNGDITDLAKALNVKVDARAQGMVMQILAQWINAYESGQQTDYTYQMSGIGGMEGMVPNYRAMGGPIGTDTVPTWLTPGEFVVNKDSAQRFGPLLHRLNSQYLAGGGYVNSAFGGSVDPETMPLWWRRQHGFETSNPWSMGARGTWAEQQANLQAQRTAEMDAWSARRGSQGPMRYTRDRNSITLDRKEYGRFSEEDAGRLSAWKDRQLALQGLSKQTAYAKAPRHRQKVVDYLTHQMATPSTAQLAREYAKTHAAFGKSSIEKTSWDANLINSYAPWLAYGGQKVDRGLVTAGKWSGRVGGTAGALAGLAAIPVLGAMGAGAWGTGVWPATGVATEAFAAGSQAAFAAELTGGFAGASSGIGTMTAEAAAAVITKVPAAARAWTLKSLLGKGLINALTYEILLGRLGPDLTGAYQYFTKTIPLADSPAMTHTAGKGMAAGGFVGGNNTYHHQNDIKIISSGNEAYDARRLASALNRETLRGTVRLH